MGLNLTLGLVAELVSGELRGDAGVEIRAVSPVSAAGPGDLTWASSPQHASRLAHCGASAVLTLPELEVGSLPAVVCPSPELALAKILTHLQPAIPHPPAGVHAAAIVDPDAVLAADVAVGPGVVIEKGAQIGQHTKLHAGVFIGQDTTIGEDCVIWPNVVVRERCKIGARVLIHPNATIGADGFGYNLEEGWFKKIPHIGTVEIGDDVEIGANACIDRAKCGATFIGRGTKIDNLVQIAHNVRVGEHCCIVSHTGIAGSTELGDHVILAGRVGVKDNISIGAGVQVAACSCIAGDIPAGETVVGIPAKPRSDVFRELAALRRLPDMVKVLRALSKRVEQLESANHS